MTAAVILAAGQGTRMNSDLPKVAHPVHGRPMLHWVLDAARQAGAARLIVVVGYRAAVVKGLLVGQGDIEFAVQEPQHGTGHAVRQAAPLLGGTAGTVLVMNGDMPLVTPAALGDLLTAAEGHACVVGTAVTERNAGLGRIVRDADGRFAAIVEERDATAEQRAITEINVGCFAFDAPALLWSLDRLTNENAQGEYYLTDCPAILKEAGHPVDARAVFPIEEALGVNTPEQLAAVERALGER